MLNIWKIWQNSTLTQLIIKCYSTYLICSSAGYLGFNTEQWILLLWRIGGSFQAGIFPSVYFLFICRSSIWSWAFNFTQLRYYKTPDIETPSYLVLKKTANYEVLFRCVYFMKNPVHCRFGVATLPWHHNPLFILSHSIDKFPSYIMRLMFIINFANMISCSRTLYHCMTANS